MTGFSAIFDIRNMNLRQAACQSPIDISDSLGNSDISIIHVLAFVTRCTVCFFLMAESSVNRRLVASVVRRVRGI